MHQHTRRRSQDGMALLFALIAIIAILGAIALVMTRVVASKKETDFAVGQATLEEASQAGVDYAVTRLWEDYISTNGNTTGNWASYRYYLDNVLDVPINEDLNGNGTQDPNEVGNGRDGFETVPANMHPWGRNLLDEELVFTTDEGHQLASVETVHAVRYDTFDGSTLTVRATATVDGVSKTAVQMLEIGGASLPHGEFSIITNNISCLLCHAEIRNLTYETDNPNDEADDVYDRVKLAALESLLVRKTEADSNIAGTLYTRGDVYKQNGSPYSENELASSDFRAYRLNNENGTLDLDGSGNLDRISMETAGRTDSGDLMQFANLYRNYPTNEEDQTDGYVPSDFPAPYPDENNNRHVDDSEFEEVINSANGKIEFEFGEEGGGEITSGVAYGVPQGSAYTDEALPTASNGALTQLANGRYDGNLILVGTEDDPIRIEDTVAINGDLVLQGKIEGKGQLYVRGNTYVVGDVTYADAPGAFGQNEEGDDNAFVLVSGGSIMMGDYLTIRGVNHSSQNNTKYPDWSRYSIHTRDEHRSNRYSGETLRWGYFDQYSSDAGEEVPGRPGQQLSFTQSELMLFNNLELEKALADNDYTPRFYGLRENQPNNVYMYYSGDEHTVRYNESGVYTIPEILVAIGRRDILDRASFHYTNPQGNWMSEDTLRQIWYNDEMTRPSSGRAFRFDGLLYSNNAIFAIVRSKERHYSNSLGKMFIRGSIIAPDLGIFAPGGFDLWYDERAKHWLLPNDTSTVEFTRVAFYYQKPYDEEEAG